MCQMQLHTYTEVLTSLPHQLMELQSGLGHLFSIWSIYRTPIDSLVLSLKWSRSNRCHWPVPCCARSTLQAKYKQNVPWEGPLCRSYVFAQKVIYSTHSIVNERNWYHLPSQVHTAINTQGNTLIKQCQLVHYMCYVYICNAILFAVTS